MRDFDDDKGNDDSDGVTGASVSTPGRRLRRRRRRDKVVFDDGVVNDDDVVDDDDVVGNTSQIV